MTNQFLVSVDKSTILIYVAPGSSPGCRPSCPSGRLPPMTPSSSPSTRARDDGIAEGLTKLVRRPVRPGLADAIELQRLAESADDTDSGLMSQMTPSKP
jgi:hypothetical protein